MVKVNTEENPLRITNTVHGISPGAREVLFVSYLPKGLIVGSIAENSADFRNAILTKIRSARFELLAF